MIQETLVLKTFQQLIDEGLLEIGDGYRAKNSELGGDGPIFLRAGHVTDSHIDFSGIERFRNELVNQLRSKMSRPGDTIITTKGNSTGRTSYVTKDMPEFVYSPHLSFWRSLDYDQLVPGFLRYWACGPEFQSQLNGMKISTDMAPYLSLTDQRRLRISLPSPHNQYAIARILGVLDDKIELNRKMNHTLESLATALFKSWFVDFDPVVAKAEGRKPYGMNAETAALFPNKFQDSELGPIPKGWRTGKLAELADINARSIKSGYSYNLIEYIDISSVSCGQLDGTTQIALQDAPSRAQRLVVHGDTIWSCVRPNRRSFLLIQHPEPNVVVSTGFAVLSPKSEIASYLHLWVTTDDFVDYLTAYAEGSAYPAVRPESFAVAPVLIPPPSVLSLFEARVISLLELRSHHERQSRTLSTLRTTLLPKLLSGELRVKQAETIVGKVA